MPPWLGGMTIVAVEWISAQTLRVEFASIHAGRHHQLYAGRSLVGTTTSITQRTIVGQVKPSVWPQAIQLMAVAIGERLTDNGSLLPVRAYNRVKLEFEADSWPSDAEHIDVYAGTAAGGAVSESNLVKRLKYDTDRAYEVLTDPLPGSGTWNFRVRGRDNRKADGNVGDPLNLSQAVLAHPPDVEAGTGGRRMTVSVAAGVATVGYELTI